MNAISRIGAGPWRLVHDLARKNACAAVMAAEQGMVVTIRPANRSKLQNALLHACLTDLSKQIERHGEHYSVTVWKRLCMASWLREKGESPMLIPALDKKGVDIIYEPTSELSVKEMSELIEWVYCYGAQNNVKFKEPR